MAADSPQPHPMIPVLLIALIVCGIPLILKAGLLIRLHLEDKENEKETAHVYNGAIITEGEVE